MDPGKEQEETLVDEASEATYLVEHEGTGSVPPVLGAPIERHYTVIDVRGGHGVSGMGIVYIVEEHGQRYAVKTFQRRFAQKLEYIQRFIREAKTWMLVGFHPNIAHAYRLDIFEAVPHLFIEYAPSDEAGRHTLAHYLRDGPLRLAQALDYAVQFCDGMIHATGAVAGLVHRDIKPDNLLITPEGRLKITDFGLVRGSRSESASLRTEDDGAQDEPAALTRAGTLFGTPAYMAPEQFDDAAEVGKTADIYAFGCCLYESIAGRPLFSATTKSSFEQLMQLKRHHLTTSPPPLRDAVPGCPPEVEALVLRCVQKDSRDRWQSFHDLRQAAADALCALTGTPASPPRSVDALPRLVAEQSRSLLLLDGYETAIQLSRLRAAHGQRPYDFHLALASYFRYQHDRQEEERQLVKALEARSEETGYEAVARLADLLRHAHRLDESDRVLAAFLTRCPGELTQVIESLVHLRIAQGRHEEATALLEKVPDTLRTQILHAELLRAIDRRCELADLLERVSADALDRIAQAVARIKPGDTVGWERKGDRHTLVTVLAGLRPELDTAVLDSVRDSVWPDLCGYPDFAPQMALLSEVFGELAKIESDCNTADANHFAEYASFLGYPHRLARHLEREEEWFWTRGGRLR